MRIYQDLVRNDQYANTKTSVELDYELQDKYWEEFRYYTGSHIVTTTKTFNADLEIFARAKHPNWRYVVSENIFIDINSVYDSGSSSGGGSGGLSNLYPRRWKHAVEIALENLTQSGYISLLGSFEP